MIDQTFEALLDSYLKARALMEEAEAEKKVIEEAILEKLREMKISGTSANGYTMQKTTRTIYSGVLLSTARELGAVKTKETVDSDKLRKLEEKGVTIKGSKKIQYLLVKEEKK